MFKFEIWKISAFNTHSQGSKANTEQKSFEDLIKSKIEPVGKPNHISLNDSSDSDIKQENKMLKNKILLLEERCSSLEEKVSLIVFFC